MPKDVDDPMLEHLLQIVGTAITNESVYGQEGAKEERKEHVLDDPSVLAIKGLGQFKEFRAVSEFRA